MRVVGPTLEDEQPDRAIGIPHARVLKEICAGIEEEGMKYRFVRLYKTADVGFVGVVGGHLVPGNHLGDNGIYVHRVEVRKPGRFPVQRTVRVDGDTPAEIVVDAELLEDPEP